MTDRRNVDAVVASLREFVQALIDQEQIAGHEILTERQQNLRDALRAAFGIKVEEHA
jgi:hypothetical protein